MEVIMPVLLALLPAIIIAGALIYALNQYMSWSDRKSAIAARSSDSTALRLQAYERLTLLCERCDFMPLLLRTQSAEMSADELHASLMIGITHEFDHNVTQQIYVSETLWKLVSSARSETLDILSAARKSVSASASREEYVNSILKIMGETQGNTPFQRALKGIRVEAAAALS